MSQDSGLRSRTRSRVEPSPPASRKGPQKKSARIAEAGEAPAILREPARKRAVKAAGRKHAPEEAAPQKLKAPKTARGQRTLQNILDAAEYEFGEKGFHEASIAGLTARAGVSIGSFYVYFDSKESVFRALVQHMGRLTRGFIAERVRAAPDRFAAERLGLAAFIEFVRTHKDLYRIVMEAQFVAEDAYRDYYKTFADAYRRNLEDAAARGEIRAGAQEERAWALIGMSVFLGLRFGVWEQQADPKSIAAAAADMIERGLRSKPEPA